MESLSKIDASRRVYSLQTSQKLVYLTGAAAFIVGAGFFFKLAIDPIGRDFVLAVGLVFLLLGFIVVSLAMRSRLILEGSRIELRSALRTFTADRSEIDGLRTIDDQYGLRTRIYLKGNRGAFNVSRSFTGDDDLKVWLKGIPDLDRRDADKITQQIDSQTSLRPAENGSSNALKRSKAWAITLSIIAVMLSIPLLFASYTPLYTTSLALLALFPLLGIVLIHRFPLLFTVFKRKTDPRADILFVLAWPGMGMAFSFVSGNNPIHFVDAFQLTFWCVVVLFCYGAALFGTAWKNPSRWGVLAGMLLFGGMYSIVFVNAVDTVLDPSAPVAYRTLITGMYETHGRHASSYLRLAPWGPVAYLDDVDVPVRLYRQVTVGAEVCIGLHPGFLQAPWYTLTLCPDQAYAPAPQIPE